ncbi:MAG: ribose 5-phosphate isomerase B [bacterium]
MTVAIGSDHAGYDLKEVIKKFLDTQNIRYQDYGTNSTESVDYPDIAVAVSRAVMKTTDVLGILVCGTGVGMSIIANKIPGIRAALCTSEKLAELSRRHNNANILTLGGRTTDAELARKIVKTFLDTPPDPEDRHQRRIQKIHDLTGN